MIITCHPIQHYQMHAIEGWLFCLEGLGEVAEASATATSISQDLPSPDTVVGSLEFASGTSAGISITFAGSVLRFSLSVTGTQGSLEVRHTCY